MGKIHARAQSHMGQKDEKLMSAKALKWVQNASFYFIKNRMTTQEAKRVWDHIKAKMPVIASRAGISRKCLGNLALLRKLQLIKAKAEEPDCCGNCGHGGLFSLLHPDLVGCKMSAGEAHEPSYVCELHRRRVDKDE